MRVFEPFEGFWTAHVISEMQSSRLVYERRKAMAGPFSYEGHDTSTITGMTY
jgi:hypothetical protein